MASVLENQTIVLTCAACGAKVRIRMSQILQADVECPACKQVLDTTKFRRSAQRIEEQLASSGLGFRARAANE